MCLCDGGVEEVEIEMYRNMLEQSRLLESLLFVSEWYIEVKERLHIPACSVQ